MPARKLPAAPIRRFARPKASGPTLHVTFTVRTEQDAANVARFVKSAIEGSTAYTIIGEVEVELRADGLLAPTEGR
jgi:hypothetical protein